MLHYQINCGRCVDVLRLGMDLAGSESAAEGSILSALRK
jgi:hypothetical protein